MKKLKFVQLTTIVLFLLLFTGMLVLALGENGRFAIVSGGGQLTAPGIHLNSAIGHPVAGRVIDVETGIVVCSGYGCGGETAVLPEEGYSLYLPAVVKP